MKKLIQGVGINDAEYTLTAMVNGNRKKCPFYSTWENMLKRCYSAAYISRRPTYNGCTVCEEWLTFSNFRRWMVKQDWKGKALDKDILFVGNKEYAPDKCCFVTREINNLLLDRKASRGKHPIGVYFDKQAKKFKAQCNENGKSIHLGCYDNPEDAHKAYVDFKRELIKSVAKNQQDQRIKSALEKRAELI